VVGICFDLQRDEVTRSRGEVNDLINGPFGEVSPSMSRMVICPDASTAQNCIAAPFPSTSSGGSTVWVLAAAGFGSKFEDFGTARIRLGYAWGRFLPYLTGGFTYGTIETFYSVATPGFFNAGTSTATRSGFFPMPRLPSASAPNMPSLQTSR
jgi:opacity protein-like surface antigen